MEEEVDLGEDVAKEDKDQIYQMRFEQHWLTKQWINIERGWTGNSAQPQHIYRHSDKSTSEKQAT